MKGDAPEADGPTPHGVGGLKLPDYEVFEMLQESHPSRGGWIEIGIMDLVGHYAEVPPLTGWVD